jgi:hypothetical protein
MTNLMEHGACTLDISSDEETEQRRRDERGKENVPPLDDISQTSLPSASYDSTSDIKAYTKSQRRRKEIEDGTIDIDRNPLGDLEAQDFYAEGCTSSDVVLVADEIHPEAASMKLTLSLLILSLKNPHLTPSTSLSMRS